VRYRRPIVTFIQCFVGFGVCGAGLFIVAGGVGLAGTGVWGYNDAGATVYLAISSIYALIGLSFFFGGVLIVRMALDPPGRRSGLELKQYFRREFAFAGGLTFALLAVALLAFCLALYLVEQSDTSEEGFASLMKVCTAAGAALSAIAAGWILRRLHSPRRPF